MARDRGLGDVLKAQVLIYPVVSDTKDHPSCEKYGQGDYLLSLKDSSVFSKTYFPVPAKELNNPYGTPLILPVEKLTGLPPALVLTAECDILRDEGEAYCTKLLAAGNDVVGVRVLGTIHGFMTIEAPPTPQYRQGLNTCISFIKDKLNL
jgi:acetyl esterase